jgi:hypothetical protein
MLRSASPSREISRPDRKTCPSSAGRIPASTWSRVDFPEPDGPIMASTSPGAIAMSTPDNARTSP